MNRDDLLRKSCDDKHVGIRHHLANFVVATYGMGMWLVFSSSLVFFIFNLAEQHHLAAMLAGSLMLTGFAGTICVAKVNPKLFRVSVLQTGYRKNFSSCLRRFRSLVGNGDYIQRIARKFDPDWQSPHSGNNPKQFAQALLTWEVIHWAALMASLGPMSIGFAYGYRIFAYVFVAVNLFYNIMPILVIRQTRRRLSRVLERKRADVSPGA